MMSYYILLLSLYCLIYCSPWSPFAMLTAILPTMFFTILAAILMAAILKKQKSSAIPSLLLMVFCSGELVN